MKTTTTATLTPHLTGTCLEDARMILQQAEQAGLSGRLTVGSDALAVSCGRLVRGDWRRLAARLVEGGRSHWSWRRVPGQPEVDFEVGINAALFAVMG